MKPRFLFTAITMVLAAGIAAAAPGPDELVMSRSAQVLGSGGAGLYELEVTVHIEAGVNVAAGLTALAVEETLPAGWSFGNVTASPPPSTVNPIAGNTYQIVWVTLPDLSAPFDFKYTALYPVDASGGEIVGKASYRTSGGQLESAPVTTPQNAISCLEMSRTVAGYNPGQSVTVEVTLTSFCGEPVTALAVEETWPAGWTFVSATGVGSANQSIAPPVGAEGTLQFIWFSPIPSFPYTFTYTMLAPVSATGDITMTGQSVARLSGPEIRTPLVESVFSRLDVTPPVITINGQNPVNVECGTAYTDAGASAIDNIDGTVAVSSSGTVNTAVVGTYTITYSATDSAGNTSTADRTVNVVDTVAPTLTLNGAGTVTVECHTGDNDAGATPADSCAGNLTASIVTTGTVNVNVPGSYTLTYTVTDPSNNSTSRTRTVNVVDTTVPTLTLNGSATLTIACKGTYTGAGATATDSCAGSLSGAVQITGTVNTSVPGAYTLVYRVSDPTGNSAVPVFRNVTVTDAVAPVITLTGAATMTVSCGGTYTEPGATALDACAGDLTSQIQVTGTVDTAVLGTYTRTYTVSDPSGNAAVPATRTVHVTDTVAPVVTLVGAASVTLECGTAFTDPGATAEDACEGSVTRFVTVTGSVNTSVPGVYTLTYDAHDSSGNPAVPVTRTVTVEDTVAPVITLLGASPLRLDCGDVFADPGATAQDVCDGTVTVASDAGEINTNYPAEYLITYTASDSHGNTATATRSVVVGGPNCDYCPMTDVVILHPSSQILIPGTVAKTPVLFSSEVLFADSGDCLEGTVAMSYTVNDVRYVPTSDRQNNFPIMLLLPPGDYTVQAEAELVETGQVITAEAEFSVVAVPVDGNGYPTRPFTTITPDGTTFSNVYRANGYNRIIEMAAATCPDDGGSEDDIMMSVSYGGNASRMLSVNVPRAVVPCGSQALVVLTLSDTIEGLVGPAESAYFLPVPDGLIQGGLFFDVSILVASLADIAAGEPVPYQEIDNAVIAEHPVSFSLSGLSFAPNFIPVFLSHASSFAPDGPADLNLFGDTGDWTDDETMGFMVQGSTLYGQAKSLSVFAPFEKEKVLTFSPDIEYGVIFGLAVLDTSIDKVFTVTNNGTLRATGQASLTDDAGVFEIVGGDGSYSLAPGESFQLTVRFTPTEVKDYEGVLNFSGVPNTNLSVRVLGTGTLGPKKFLAKLGCGASAPAGSGGDLLALLGAVALLAAGGVSGVRRRHS